MRSTNIFLIYKNVKGKLKAIQQQQFCRLEKKLQRMNDLANRQKLGVSITLGN